MYHPAAVYAEPSPGNKRWEAAHTGSWLSSAAAMIPIMWSARSSLEKRRTSNQHQHLLWQTILDCIAGVNLIKDGPMGPGWAAVIGLPGLVYPPNVVSLFSCSPSSGCLFVGALVSAVVAKFSLHAWAVQVIPFEVFSFSKNHTNATLGWAHSRSPRPSFCLFGQSEGSVSCCLRFCFKFLFGFGFEAPRLNFPWELRPMEYCRVRLKLIYKIS